MNINIITRNCKIKEHEHDYIITKMEHLGRFHIKIEHIDVVIKKEGHQYSLELILKALQKDFLIKKHGSTVDEVIDILVDKMGHHLTKHKDRIKEHHKEKLVLNDDKEFSDIAYTLSYKSVDDFEKMSKQEAAYEVSHSNEKFLIYVDLYTDKLSVAVFKDHLVEIVES